MAGSVLRSTIFGIVEVHALQLAENSLFNDCLNVARRQIGCMRFCHVPRHCRTPRRHRCQPDEVVAAVRARKLGAEAEQREIAAETRRVRPHYDSRRYGRPGYARLSAFCAPEIRRGADDESEMGVYHDLFQPQREANPRGEVVEVVRPLSVHPGQQFDPLAFDADVRVEAEAEVQCEARGGGPVILEPS